jgi:hypothetical protein
VWYAYYWWYAKGLERVHDRKEIAKKYVLVGIKQRT